MLQAYRMNMLKAYREHAERAALGIPPLPLMPSRWPT
jgi:aconitase B